MAGRGRPKGAGIDDRETIAQVRRAMRADSSLSRRRAILSVVEGDSNLRRIEMKMNGMAEPAPIPGIDEAFSAGEEATVALFSRLLGAPLDQWETRIVGMMVRDGNRFADLMGSINRMLKKEARSPADMAELWLMLSFVIEEAAKDEADPEILEMLSELQDFDPALMLYQRSTTHQDWSRRTERLRTLFGMEDLADAFPRLPAAELWSRSLVTTGGLPPRGMISTALANGVGEPFVGVLAMPVAQQEILASQMLPDLVRNEDVVDTIIAAWSVPGVLERAEALCSASAFCVPALLHVQAAMEPFPYLQQWHQGVDRDAEAALRCLGGHRSHLAGIGGYLHFLLERRLGHVVHEEFVEPATDLLLERTARAQNSYWSTVEDLATKSREDDLVGSMIDPDALLYRRWRPDFDHAPYLLRWLGTQQGKVFMRKHEVDDSVGRAALALHIQRVGTLPDLSESWGKDALRSKVLSELETSTNDRRSGAAADLDRRCRIVLSAMRSEHRHETTMGA